MRGSSTLAHAGLSTPAARQLLHYFGEIQPCGNCDNCLTPPTFGTPPKPRADAHASTRAAGRHQLRPGHLMDILRGKATEKVAVQPRKTKHLA